MSILKKDQTSICPICNNNKILTKKYCTKECKKIGVAKSCKETFMKIYGVENISQIEDIKLKKKQTKLKNYGDENFYNKTKAISTCLAKYGVENPTQIIQIKKKIKDTCIKKYGVDNPGKCDIIKSKIKNTCIEKYGVQYSWQAEKTKDKIKATNNNRYGVDYPMQNAEIFEKMQKSGKKVKEYIFPSGRKVNVRGYEPFALDILINEYTEDDIVVRSKNMTAIWYEFQNKRKRYYPDIFIISVNKFIEVKSIYTYEADLEKNLAKQKACLNNNFNFEFMIFDNGKLI
jgi:hypothetical protein